MANAPSKSELQKLTMDELFHSCWGQAHDSPDYDKRVWKTLVGRLADLNILDQPGGNPPLLVRAHVLDQVRALLRLHAVNQEARETLDSDIDRYLYLLPRLSRNEETTEEWVVGQFEI